jgi:hypothetical protein
MTKPHILAIKIFVGSVSLIFITHVIDFILNKNAPSLFYALYTVDAHASLNTIGSLAEVISSLFGIIITVVAIIVNLSANRYTQKMIDIFINEKINLIVLSLFSITSLYGIWIINSVHTNNNLETYIPRVQILTYLFLISLSIILIVPYFYYVFQFLNPKNIISKIEKQILLLLNRAQKLKTTSRKKDNTNEDIIKQTIVSNLNQLTEICKSSVNKTDQSLALLSLTSLQHSLMAYIKLKESHLKKHIGELPFDRTWYTKIDNFFLGLNKPIIQELQNQKFWFEYKILEELESIFVYASEKDTKVTYQTAIILTEISTECIHNKDIVLFCDTIRFFNTLLKVCITKSDSQNMLYVFYQYYLTCRNLIDHFNDLKGSDPKKLVINIAKYFKNYGQLGERKQVAHILEYSAYFLRLINEKVYNQFKKTDIAFVESVLNIFLTVDDIPRHKSNEEALLGVRQHQVILASYYMVHHSDGYDPKALVNSIYKDLKDESPARKKEILDLILEIDQEKHHEIDNLGINPIFIKKQYKEKLEIFFNRYKGVKYNVPESSKVFLNQFE